jgi:hypothetical protein
MVFHRNEKNIINYNVFESRVQRRIFAHKREEAT